MSGGCTETYLKLLKLEGQKLNHKGEIERERKIHWNQLGLSEESGLLHSLWNGEAL